MTACLLSPALSLLRNDIFSRQGIPCNSRTVELRLKTTVQELCGMEAVGTIKGVVAAWISNYYQGKNRFALFQFS
jgi:hypothetical protein